MAAKRERRWFAPYMSYVIGREVGHMSTRALDCTSHVVFMHETGFPAIFIKIYILNMVVL
jgi:hypothetical protein